jgi:hypothetical protein
MGSVQAGFWDFSGRGDVAKDEKLIGNIHRDQDSLVFVVVRLRSSAHSLLTGANVSMFLSGRLISFHSRQTIRPGSLSERLIHTQFRIVVRFFAFGKLMPFHPTIRWNREFSAFAIAQHQQQPERETFFSRQIS